MENTINDNRFDYVSLFAGIGGFDTALNDLGGRCVMASEIDKFAAKAYETLYGVAPEGDITKIESDDIPDHDLLTAGFPCQAFSVAGKRAGMAYVCDDCNHEQTITFEEYADRSFVCEVCSGNISAVDGRGLLFFEVARVARDKQTSVLLLENVKGLVGHDKGRTLDVMVKTLNDVGYTIDFEVLNTKYFGLPQNRERIFIVAVRDDVIDELGITRGWNDESLKGNTVIPKGKRRIAGYDEVKTFNFDFPTNDTVTKRLQDVLENDVDERYYLDYEKTAALVAELNEKVEGVRPVLTPQDRHGVMETGVAEGTIKNCDSALSALENFAKKEGRLPKMFNPYNEKGITNLAPTQTTSCNRVNNSSTVLIHDALPMDCEIDVVGKLESSYDSGGRVYGVNGQSPTISARDYKGPKLVAEKRSDEIIHVGNLNMKANRSVRAVHSPEGQCPTLTTMGGGHREPKIAENTGQEDVTHRIRKLTPLECWRLQGFTDEQHNAVEQAGISNTQRYKQAGNAVSVPVIKAVATRLLPYIL